MSQLALSFEAMPMARRRDPSIFPGAILQRFTLLEEVVGARGWRARCVCGEERTVRIRDIKSGHRVSCGCFSREQSSLRAKTHGHGTRAKTPTYRTWQHMVSRCHSPSDDNYFRYGAVGIYVCQEWRSSFEAFLEDMGERPAGKTIDRIDGREGYSPSNCRWATQEEQVQNTTRAKLTIETAAALRALKGSMSTRAAGKQFGISHHAVRAVWAGKAWRNA